jgi:predicted alternative tryptophan synthase beta-subunit
MKEAKKRLISNETSQDRFIRLKDVVKRYAAKKSIETSLERASRLEKHDFESTTAAGKIQ